MLKRTTSLFILVAFYVLLVAFLAEGLIRLFNLAAPASAPGFFWRTDVPLTGWALEPNARGRWFNPLHEYDVDVQINSRGLRSPEEIDYAKPEDVYRIIVLGDSYVEALQVPLAESFPQQLGQRLRAAGLRAEVINAGVSGWGTDQQLLWLREEGARYQPDLVVLALYPGNDFMNNHMPLEYANFGGVRKPFFEWQEDGLFLRNFPHDAEQARELAKQFEQQAAEISQSASVEADAAEDGGKPFLRGLGEWLHAHSALYRYLDPRVRVTAPGAAVQLVRWGLIEPGQETSDAAIGPEYVPVTYGVYQQPPAPEWERAFTVSGALFAALRDAAREMNAEISAVLITAPEQVDPARWQRILQRYPAMQSADWSLDQSTRRAEELLAAAQIPVLNLVPLFQQAAADGAKLHLRDDGHWTTEGHALAAAATGNFLIGAGLIPQPAGQTIPVNAPRSWSWWELFVWLIVALLLLSLAVSICQAGPRAWARGVGVRLGTAGELLLFTAQRRQFVLLPIVVILLLFGGLLIIAQASVVGPFIYTLF
jgi:lysophospholipase L1-like esterase